MPKDWLSRNLDKFIWPTVVGVIGGVLTPLILSWIQTHSPKIVVRQYYNTVEPKKTIPKEIGGLILDYQPEETKRRSLYLVEVTNEGKGSEEDLRVQVGFSPEMNVTFGEEPDFRVYRAEEINLNRNKFFMSLRQFPSQARAPVSFEIGDPQKLCETQIKVAGKEREGKVETIRGIQCE